MISPTRAANVILEAAQAEGRLLTPLQVMKLVYISHGWHLAFADAPLITENIQAWQYGPVIPSLYHDMKHFRSSPIQPPRLSVTMFDTREPSPEQVQHLRNTFKTYGKFSGAALSNLTHKPGSPWSRVWRPGATHLVIPNDLIKAHYLEALRKKVLDAA